MEMLVASVVKAIRILRYIIAVSKFSSASHPKSVTPFRLTSALYASLASNTQSAGRLQPGCPSYTSADIRLNCRYDRIFQTCYILPKSLTFIILYKRA
jgi:hypothetical protein